MIEERINKDYIEAMKARDAVRSGTLNFLRAQLKNVHIDKKVDILDDADVIAAIKKQIKQRQDSIEQYSKGGRQDLADKETTEMGILKTYLPEEMSEADIVKMIGEAVKEVEASSIKDMGKVMKAVSPKIAGRADGKLVSDLVKKALS